MLWLQSNVPPQSRQFASSATHSPGTACKQPLNVMLWGVSVVSSCSLLSECYLTGKSGILEGFKRRSLCNGGLPPKTCFVSIETMRKSQSQSQNYTQEMRVSHEVDTEGRITVETNSELGRMQFQLATGPGPPRPRSRKIMGGNEGCVHN